MVWVWSYMEAAWANLLGVLDEAMAGTTPRLTGTKRPALEDCVHGRREPTLQGPGIQVDCVLPWTEIWYTRSGIALLA